MNWQPIDTAPTDGTVVVAGKRGPGIIMWSQTRMRFLDGRWCMDLGCDWAPVDPQPTEWVPDDHAWRPAPFWSPNIKLPICSLNAF